MSDLTPTYLLDKNIVRKAISGLVRLQAGLAPADVEIDVLSLLWLANEGKFTATISPETANVLRRYAGHPTIDLILIQTEVLRRGRYFKRWARRLLDYEFTYEDAKVLSLGTFGANQAADRLGVSAIITLDLHLINNLQARGSVIQDRLQAMVTQITPPYDQARLPSLFTPDEALIRLVA